MDLSQVIIGQVVTEKSERLKVQPRKVHTILVAPKATKVDVKNALKKYYDVDAESVRMIRVRPKTRTIGRGRSMEKRHRSKKAMVTLAAKSKNLDIATFQVK